ncbi:MAG: selenium cofactor biosynthesis protein YqeC [Actinomycetota bacterium]
MESIIPLNSIAEALGLMDSEAGHHISLVGGGGKTTLLHAIGSQIQGKRILTTTTKMGSDQNNGIKTLINPNPSEILEIEDQAVVIWKEIQGPKAIGVERSICDEWFTIVDHVIVEADGSRKRPFKAPADHEPVVPLTTTLMIVTIGSDALGRVIADQCHRPLRVAALAGCEPYQRLDPSRAAKVLLSDRGNLKELPKGSEMKLVVTKVTEENSHIVDVLESCIKSISPTQEIFAVTFDEKIGKSKNGQP